MHFFVLLQHFLLPGEHIQYTYMQYIRRATCHHSEDALWPMLASCIMLASILNIEPEDENNDKVEERDLHLCLMPCCAQQTTPTTLQDPSDGVEISATTDHLIMPHPFHISGSSTAVFLVSPHLIDGFWEEFPPPPRHQ